MQEMIRRYGCSAGSEEKIFGFDASGSRLNCKRRIAMVERSGSAGISGILLAPAYASPGYHSSLLSLRDVKKLSPNIKRETSICKLMSLEGGLAPPTVSFVNWWQYTLSSSQIVTSQN